MENNRSSLDRATGAALISYVGALGIWRRVMGIEPTGRSPSTRPDRF